MIFPEFYIHSAPILFKHAGKCALSGNEIVLLKNQGQIQTNCKVLFLCRLPVETWGRPECLTLGLEQGWGSREGVLGWVVVVELMHCGLVGPGGDGCPCKPSQKMGSPTTQVCKSPVLFGNLCVLIIHFKDFLKSIYSQNRDGEVSLYHWGNNSISCNFPIGVNLINVTVVEIIQANPL